MDRLTGIEIFVALAEEESFTATAQRLGLARSQVSKHIAALEDRLGARLLHRTTRRVSLTEVGKAYYDRALRIMADLEEAENAVQALHAEPRGTLRLNTPLSFGIRHLGKTVASFMQQHPGLVVDTMLTDRFVDLVEEGVDMALRIGELQDSSLIARKLANISRVAVASVSYLEQHGVPKHPSDLEQHRCLVYRRQAGADDSGLLTDWCFTNSEGSEALVRVTGHLVANNGDFLREAALQGSGVLLSPLFIVGRDVAEGSLQVLFPDWKCEATALHAIYPPGRHLSAKVRLFVDHLADCIKRTPDWETRGL